MRETERRYPITLAIPCKGADCVSGKKLLAQASRIIGIPVLIPNLEYGEAIKRAIKYATTPLIATMDADGQHRIGDLVNLIEYIAEYKFDMVIGQRQAQWNPRGAASCALNLAASIVAGKRVPDFGSGLRVFDTVKARALLTKLPDGFDFNAALTMGFLVAGHKVAWYPIQVDKRTKGKSFVTVADGLTTFRTILRAGK